MKNVGPSATTIPIHETTRCHVLQDNKLLSYSVFIRYCNTPKFTIEQNNRYSWHHSSSTAWNIAVIGLSLSRLNSQRSVTDRNNSSKFICISPLAFGICRSMQERPLACGWQESIHLLRVRGKYRLIAIARRVRVTPGVHTVARDLLPNIPFFPNGEVQDFHSKTCKLASKIHFSSRLLTQGCDQTV